MTVTVSRVRGLFTVLLAWLALLAGGATPAVAHAVLTTSTPAQGEVTVEPPSRVSLVFTEEVSLTPDAFRVLDPSGHRVDDARPSPEGDASYSVGLRDALPRGTYTVAYQVVSADSHPVAGAFTFSVGEPSATTASAATGVRDPDTGLVGRAYAVARFGAYLGMLLLTGAVTLLLLTRGQGPPLAFFRRCAATGWALATGATALHLLLRGAYTGSGRVSDIADPGLLADALATKAGALPALRLVLLVGCATPWLVRRATAPRAVRRAVPTGASLAGVALAGVALAWTWAGAEHASTGPQPWLAMPADVVHMLAAGVWVGGLLVLAAGLLRPGGVPASTVVRFSSAAFASVCLLVVTGLYQSWRQVGSPTALLETRYGRLLLLKVAGVALLLAVGALSRRWTGRLAAAPEGTSQDPSGAASGKGALRALRRSVLVEAALGLGIVVVTTALTATGPARSGLPPTTAASAPMSMTLAFDTGGPGGAGDVGVVVDPGAAGPNALHLSVTGPDGDMLDVPELKAAFTSPSADIGPLVVPLRRVSEGHWTVADFHLPAAGAWEMTLTVRTSDFDQTTVRRSLSIR
ncbi:copper resistance CopC/CopD family protein [Streptomyces abyssomicinicus]|uniref:copper resistance CopC/CopD family protein n=1 Tax=Streptomyces abyssomicinicus TaxID=574929 RepID=UPI0012509883|nr:copper resistance protein CopC [Streptomyces abyssomicinicus]